MVRPQRELLVSRRPVATANLIVALTAFMFGSHLSLSDVAFPPKKKGKLPLRVVVHSNNSLRSLVHFVHLKRKWSTVSRALPHMHWFEGAAPIRWRKSLSLAMPVRSCARILASLLVNWSYITLVCFPGSALSIFLECFPNFSGSFLLIGIVLANARYSIRLISWPGPVPVVWLLLLLLSALPFWPSTVGHGPRMLESKPLLRGSLDPTYSAHSHKYAPGTEYSCPLCWRDCAIICIAALFLVKMVMVRFRRAGNIFFIACATTASSPDVGFCSALGPRVRENVSVDLPTVVVSGAN